MTVLVKEDDVSIKWNYKHWKFYYWYNNIAERIAV